jgi:putative FmdB family regulatory protein
MAQNWHSTCLSARSLIAEAHVPTYQYACTACGHQLEAVQSFSDAALTECPVCEGRLRKLFSSVGIVFKGSGFYRTDSRNGSPESASSDSKTSESKSSDTKTSDTKSASAPAAATAGASSSSTPASSSSSSSSSSSAAA